MDLVWRLTVTGGADRAELPKFAEVGFENVKLGWVEAVVDPAARLAGLNQLGVFEGFEVEGEFGLVDVEGCAQIADATFPIAQ